MNRALKGALALLTTLAFIPGCATRSTQDELRAEIEAANRRFESAVAAADAAQVAASYTANAELLPPHSDIVSGKAAIEKFWAGAISSGVSTARLTTLEAEGHGDTAHEVGRYMLVGAAGDVLDNGKYVVIWKREQDQWRLHRDIWTTNRPASAK